MLRDWRLACLVALTAAVVLVQPMLFTHPRLWAEEATLYLKFAYLHSLLDGVLFVPVPELGYLYVAASLPAAVVSRLPLELAAHALTYYAFALWTLLFATVLYGRSLVWNRPHERVAVCLAILGLSFLAPEVWINVTNIQIYVAALVVCVLVGPADGPAGGTGAARRWYGRGVVVFGGLSGLYSVALLPAFVKKALDLKTREATVQAALLGGCAAVQLALFGAARAFSESSSARLAGLPLARRLLFLAYYEFVNPLTGGHGGGAAVRWLGLDAVHVSAEAAAEPAHVLLAVLAAACAAGVILCLWWRPRHAAQTWLFLAFVATVAAVSFGALRGVPGGRYSILPGFILLCMLLHASTLGSPGGRARARAIASKVLLATAILANLGNVSAARRRLSYGGEVPDWRGEVAQWRLDPDRRLRVLPGPGWHLYLPLRESLIELNRALADGLAAGGGHLPELALAPQVLSRLPLEFDVYVDVVLEHPASFRAGRLALDGSRGQVRLAASGGSDAGADRLRLRFAHRPNLRRRFADVLATMRSLESARLEIDTDPPVGARVESICLAGNDLDALFVLDPAVWSR
jgi:hypothetical protein